MLAVFLIVAGVLKTGIFGNDETKESSIVITRETANESRTVEAKKHILSTTTTTTTTTTTEPTTEKETTTEKFLSLIYPSTWRNPLWKGKGYYKTFEIPSKMVYHSNGSSATYNQSYSEEMIDIFNTYIFDRTAENIDTCTGEKRLECMKKGKAIELRYDCEYEIMIRLNENSSRTFYFTKVLFCLEGEYKGYMSFYRPSNYNWYGPIKFTNQDFMKEVLSVETPKVK